MPFRPGIISNTEDYVGETAALRRRLLQTKGAKQEVLQHFEDEQDLFGYSDDLEIKDKAEKALVEARRGYQLAWARVKWEEGHSGEVQGFPHTTCPMCSLCSCTQETFRFRCICERGMKMMSPDRWVFVNSAVAWEYRNTTWDINDHRLVPKNKPGLRPDWQEFRW